MKKRIRLLTFTLAGLMAAGTAAQAATVLAPVETGVTAVKEDFQNISKDRSGSNWIDEEFGLIHLGDIWCDGGLDVAKTEDASKQDPSKQSGDMALHLKNDERTGQLRFSSAEDMQLKEGDIITFSFDYATNKIDTDEISIRIYAGNDDIEADAGEGNYFKFTSLDGNKSLVTNAPYRAYLNSLWGLCYGEDEWQSLGEVHKTGAFVNYKIVINTKDSEADNKQTISFYLNNALRKKSVMQLCDKNGTVISSKPIDYIAKIRGNVNPGEQTADMWIDNVEYIHQSVPNAANIGEDFVDAKYSRASEYVFNNPSSKLTDKVSAASGGKIKSVKVADASLLPNSGKEAGDNAVQVTFGNNPNEIIFFTMRPDVTLKKGDIYSYSFEYYEQDPGTATHKLELIMNSNPAENWFDSTGPVLGPKYSYQSINYPETRYNSNKTLFTNSNSFYLFNGAVENERWSSALRTPGFNRYDIVINTADPQAQGRQTLAIYRNGNLYDKGYFYEEGKDTPVEKIDCMCLRLERLSGASGLTYAFDNFWSLKTENKLTVDEANDKVTVSYDYPALYETGVASIMAGAWYGENEEMLSADTAGVTTDDKGRKVTYEFTGNASAKYAKFFMWKDYNSLVPLTPAVTVIK
ncbi:MAG: hypothetical protein J6N52_06375 [Clostridia bacterium]|nr:hypothetical protein [Clostridia bacterium]